jgi:peptidyl-prolyl cis-trans isomerase B (cyclophilin B)
MKKEVGSLCAILATGILLMTMLVSPAVSAHEGIASWIVSATEAKKAEGSTLQVSMKTTKGVIVIDLFPDKAPLTVANFINLSVHKYYDGLLFHRVIPNFMVQGGDPTGTGRGGPGYRFKDECVPELAFDKPGYLAMANAGPGTNGSQFFITHVPTPWLNGKHTIFGTVREGQEVVNSIKQEDKIESIEFKGDYSALMDAQKAQLDEWNKILDTKK